ncbi:hypothetical protein ACFYYR_00810 [Streptomyces sp. NPDC001922]|uniref:hypothetical protein n=1 Tax=Streptomyces sp. NPDC001922 TaxID=3364624 RepID=UPI003676C110
MTVCAPAPETTADSGTVRPTPLTISAEGSYGARLAGGAETGNWFPERWTLGGPEPYVVPLPGNQPEEPDSELLPLADGRVLIRRRVADRYAFSLLYPTGPGTGELSLGGVVCERLTLLPPVPGGTAAYALAHGERSTALWRVYDGRPRDASSGPVRPEHVVELRGRCSGGAWLDRTGRLLALDQQPPDGRVKTVAVDLGRGGAISPLLQITEESNDRLLLADPDSGLLLVRSDAPGHERLGWGVLGSSRPVRFPEALRLPDAAVTPFAVQPGQMLMPEHCAVALRIDGAGGSRVGVWRPSGRELRQLTPPEGWLAGAGLWTPDGELRLPYATAEVPCGLARMTAGTRAAGPGPDRAPGESRAEGTARTPQAGHGPAQGPACGPVQGPVTAEAAPTEGAAPAAAAAAAAITVAEAVAAVQAVETVASVAAVEAVAAAEAVVAAAESAPASGAEPEPPSQAGSVPLPLPVPEPRHAEGEIRDPRVSHPAGPGNSAEPEGGFAAGTGSMPEPEAVPAADHSPPEPELPVAIGASIAGLDTRPWTEGSHQVVEAWGTGSPPGMTDPRQGKDSASHPPSRPVPLQQAPMARTR